jgi:hypothetical protein
MLVHVMCSSTAAVLHVAHFQVISAVRIIAQVEDIVRMGWLHGRVISLITQCVWDK